MFIGRKNILQQIRAKRYWHLSDLPIKSLKRKLSNNLCLSVKSKIPLGAKVRFNGLSCFVSRVSITGLGVNIELSLLRSDSWIKKNEVRFVYRGEMAIKYKRDAVVKQFVKPISIEKAINVLEKEGYLLYKSQETGKQVFIQKDFPSDLYDFFNNTKDGYYQVVRRSVLSPFKRK